VANLFVEMMQLQDADFVLHIQRVMNWILRLQRFGDRVQDPK
jgi:hypothetical protein